MALRMKKAQPVSLYVSSSFPDLKLQVHGADGTGMNASQWAYVDMLEGTERLAETTRAAASS
jgi:hypothetical protein